MPEVTISDGSSAGSSLPPFAPDIVEQNYPELIDNAVPTASFVTSPLIGLGGSAGSIPMSLRD